MNKELIKLELTDYELALLTALVMGLREDEGEIFEGMEGKVKKVADEAYAGLLSKVSMANLEYMLSNNGSMDAEILEEDVDE